MKYSLVPTASPAIYFDQQTYSYYQLHAMVEELAKKWKHYTTPGERIALVGANSPHWIASFFAAWRLGLVVVPIDPFSSSEEIAYIIRDCSPSLIVSGHAVEEKVQQALRQADSPCRIELMESVSALDSKSSGEEFFFFQRPENEAVIIYTSGTTGGPKGVVLTYQNLLVNVHAVTRGVPIILSTDCVLAMLPFHHIFPLAGSLLATMLTGASMVIPKELAADHLLQCLKTYRVTLLLAVPRFYSLIHQSMMKKIKNSVVASALFSLCHLLQSPRLAKIIFSKAHLALGGNIRHMICGGAAIDPEVERDLVDLGFSFLVGYGMSECAPMISFTRPGDIVLGSSGLPLPNVEVKIVDGEIWVKGENVMRGYYCRPDETESNFEQGYLKTGDLGHFDRQGRLFITGRKKEIIVLASGKNINPEEIENKLLRSCTQIEEVAVTQHRNGLHAIFVPSLGSLHAAGIHNLQEYFQVSVIDRYNGEVAPYKRILSFSLQSSPLPRTRLGKLRRHQLVAENNREVAAPTGAALSGELKTIFEKLCEHLQVFTSITILPQHHLEIDLSLDSLDKINLLAFISKEWNVKIDERELGNFSTVEDLCHYIQKNRKPLAETKESRSLQQIPQLSDQTSILGGLRLASKLLFPAFRVKLSGQDYLSSQSTIYICNHLSFIDALLLIRILPFSIVKNIFFGAKQKHLNSGLSSLLIKSTHIIPIDVNQDLAQSVEQMGEVLKQGKSLLLFPEGTRSRTGELGTFKRLFAQLAIQYSVPITPIVLFGTDRFLPPNRVIPRFGVKLAVKVLPPIFPQNKDAAGVVLESWAAVKRTIELG